MKMPSNYASARVNEGLSQPEAGGYVLGCINAIETQSKAGNPMIVFDFDIAEGDFRGYFTKLSDKHDFKSWPLKYYQVINEDNAGRYKGVVESFNKSNMDFPTVAFDKEDHDVSKFISFKIGAVMGIEEYEKSDRTIGSGLKIKYLTSKGRIEKGDFTIPEIKTIEKSESQQETNASFTKEDDDLPF